MSTGIKTALTSIIRIQPNGVIHSTSSLCRAFSTSATSVAAPAESSSSSPLDQFRDTVSRQNRFTELVGRSWSVKELRRKSFDDLHKLWLVLYKEKNMLLTESNICRQNGVYFPQKERQQKVKKSMAAIKVVLGERKRDKIAQSALDAMQEQNETENLS